MTLLLFQLIKFQGRYYDSIIIHTTIVFTRYIILPRQNRISTDNRTLGGMFYELCDEINELDWAVALQQLIELFEDTLQHTIKTLKTLIQSQIHNWFEALLSNIRAYLPNLSCES
jgi:hypothetical protein